jgi:hypothetical protein
VELTFCFLESSMYEIEKQIIRIGGLHSFTLGTFKMELWHHCVRPTCAAKLMYFIIDTPAANEEPSTAHTSGLRCP